MDPAVGRILLIVFGILGNIISFLVYLSPIPTFIKIYRNKSARGFQSLPYNLSLFSCIIWTYYAYNKPSRSMLLIMINFVGCFIESAYIIIYVIYAPKKDRMRTIQMFVGLNLVLFALIVAVTQFIFDGSNRATILGWICVAFSISVYAAPLSIIRVVVRTRSVEFMPIGMSFCLTLSAAIWLGYGVFSHDIFVTIPTVIGFFFGVAQMVIYVIYKRMGCGPREAAAAAAEDGSGETSAARDSEFADAVEEDDAASESSSFIVPVASIPILTSEVLIFIKKKDRRARQGRSSRSATHVAEGSEPPRASSLDLEMPQKLEEEKDQRGKRVVEVEVGESSNTKEPTVTEHISKIAEHIAVISGHIVKLAEMNPTPNPDAPLDSSAAAAAEEKDGEEDQPVAMPSAVHEHVINMEKLTSVADTEAAAETKKSSKASKRVKA